MGFLEEVEGTKSFTLGPRILNLGYAYLASKDIIEVSRVDLDLLRDATNVSAHLAILDRKEVLYLSCVQTRSGFLSNLNVGTRLPAYATPMGWLLLSDLTSREMSKLFGEDEFVPMTDQTPKDLGELMAKVSQAASRGFAVSRGAVEAGGSSIAAPILNRDGQIVAAIDISGPDSAFDMSRIETRDVEDVMNAAQRISARLGHQAKRGGKG
jgi:DNA-binding IclR family transcriptional regulator